MPKKSISFHRIVITNPKKPTCITNLIGEGAPLATNFKHPGRGVTIDRFLNPYNPLTNFELYQQKVGAEMLTERSALSDDGHLLARDIGGCGQIPHRPDRNRHLVRQGERRSHGVRIQIKAPTNRNQEPKAETMNTNSLRQTRSNNNTATHFLLPTTRIQVIIPETRERIRRERR